MQFINNNWIKSDLECLKNMLKMLNKCKLCMAIINLFLKKTAGHQQDYQQIQILSNFVVFY